MSVTGLKSKIAVTVIVATRNEAPRIRKCLEALKAFAEIVLVDSNSADGTQDIAADMGARVVNFAWSGTYPKKRQWCLDVLDLAHDWVFFVDADEIVTTALVEALQAVEDLDAAAGYFVKGVYVFEGEMLRYGLQNNKLCLINRRKIAFPVVDDLDIEGMGEIEGHYQPQLLPGFEEEQIGQIAAPLIHEAYEDEEAWLERHKRYAAWERGMDARKAWPEDVSSVRRMMKKVFKSLPFRGWIAFLHCYIWKRGFLDGGRGFRFAQSRKRYYEMI